MVQAQWKQAGVAFAVCLLVGGGATAAFALTGEDTAGVRPERAASSEDGKAGEMDYRSKGFTNPAGQTTSGVVKCPKGKHATGGGLRISSDDGTQLVLKSAGADGADTNTVPDNGWEAIVRNLGGSDSSFVVSVICHA